MRKGSNDRSLPGDPMLTHPKLMSLSLPVRCHGIPFYQAGEGEASARVTAVAAAAFAAAAPGHQAAG
jgi:hypothetical protein